MPARAVCTSILLALLGAVSASPAFAQWSVNGNAVCVYAGEQSYPASAPDGAGGAFVIWADYRSGGGDLYLQRITSTGSIAPGWPSGGAPLCTAAGDQRSPSAASDGAGGVFVVWEDDRAGGSDPNLYLQRFTATGLAAAGWPADGFAVCAAPGTQRNVALAVESGAALLAWQDDRDGAASDVYAQRVSGAGLIQWAPDGVAVCAAAGSQTSPSIVSDRNGGAIFAWQDTRGANADIYAQRLDALGVVLWPSGGNTLCAAAYDQLTPHLVADGVGGAIAVWNDYRSLNSDVYAQRVSASGAAAWTAGGVILCSNTAEQYCYAPVTDGAGGAIVPWDDFRATTVGNLYAQRITASGAIAAGWTANGTALSNAGDVSDPVAAPDGLGGAFFAWDDARAGSSAVDLYAVRLTSAGSVGGGWTAGGTLLCNAASNQLGPALGSDGSGSAIVSWYDNRNGNFDIYAQRIAVGGSTVDVPSFEPDGFALAAAPNPMRVSTRLRFRLATAATTRLEVLDVAGRVVRVVLDRTALPAGPHEVIWDGRDATGAPAPAGLYFARLVGPAPEVQRLTLLR